MSDSSIAPLWSWLAAPLDRDVSEALERLRCAPDVQQVAVMPDVHLAAEVCIGVVVATSHLIYPQAVGGDIGCGMLAVAVDVEAAALKNPKTAAHLLNEIGRAVPSRRRNRNAVIPQPAEIASDPLSHAPLEAIRQREGEIEFATLGSGNHFLEMQADEEDRLWLMVHSGSRALGQVIRDHHLARTQLVEGRLRALDAESDNGKEYLHDALWARQFAAASRKAMAEETGKVLTRALKCSISWETMIAIDHNHVALERHGERELWVHRKGAMSAQQGQPGVLPGSMGRKNPKTGLFRTFGRPRLTVRESTAWRGGVRRIFGSAPGRPSSDGISSQQALGSLVARVPISICKSHPGQPSAAPDSRRWVARISRYRQVPQ
jgi:tRNA-splicing ligase RtcB (3'-phosphate/5'-hydroxy nucleic acid ligase)